MTAREVLPYLTKGPIQICADLGAKILCLMFELDRRVEGSPQSRNGRSAQEHVTQIQPVDGVSLLPGGRLPSPPVASSNTTPELSKSTDLPIPHDDRARTSLTREPRHRSLRDSIGAHLRASSAKAEKSVPRTSGPPLVAHIAAPEPAARSEDTGFVVDVNEQQTEDPSRLSAPVIMAHTRARLARARAERDSTPFADVLAPGEDSATASAEDTGPVPRASRTRLLRRLDTERSTAAEMRLRTQAHLRTRLAGERQLATQDRVGGGGGGDVDKGARSARELGGVVHLVPDDAAPEDPGREAALRARLRGRAS
ncbi:hypothetical protein BC834DRAFT_301449 [Gloeopeniophorella convolvens]|nr:hypothetical protein BC834DRAFT_301449 [Gloeopeniophorella convolvens]